MLCEYCGKVGHLVESCFALNPHLALGERENGQTNRSMDTLPSYSQRAQFAEPRVQSSAVTAARQAETLPTEADDIQ